MPDVSGKEEEITKLYRAGESLRRIEYLTGVPRYTAHRFLKERGVVKGKAPSGRLGGDSSPDYGTLLRRDLKRAEEKWGTAMRKERIRRAIERMREAESG